MNRDVSSQAPDGGTIEGIFHPVISVRLMDDALAFYRDVLGLRVTFDDLHDPAAIARLFGLVEPIVRSVIVECDDGSEIELVEFQRPRGRAVADRRMPDAGLAALNLRVAGMAAIAERIQAAGFAMTSEIVEQTLPDGAILKAAVCLGPDGVTIILVEPPAGRRSLGGNG